MLSEGGEMVVRKIIDPTHSDMAALVREQNNGRLTLVSFGDKHYGIHIVFDEGPICKCRGQRLIPAAYLYTTHLCRRCWMSYRKRMREETTCQK
jgi:hypothetical protein